MLPAGGEGTTELPIPGEEIPFEVEVLNGTRIDGLARATTLALRRRGIDVVSYGTASDQGLESTRIIVLRGDSTPGYLIREALGLGSVEVALDSSELLDVRILLGSDAGSIEVDP